MADPLTTPAPTSIVKAHFVGERKGDQSNLSPAGPKDAESSPWAKVTTLVPPYDPEKLLQITESSSSIHKNIEAYVTNIHGFGHRFEPVLDFDADDIDEQIRDALRLEKNGLFDLSVDNDPSDDEVKTRKEQVKKQMRAEKAMLDIYFDQCSVSIPFTGVEGLRGRTGKDLEEVGYAFWEVLRNGRGKPAQYNHVSSQSIRLLPIDEDPIAVEIPSRASSLRLGTTKAYKVFRKYVQIVGGSSRVTYFKEFGDPRAMSSLTGKVYENKKALEKEEPGVSPATELIEFKIYNGRSAYGVPRWVGVLLAVLGTADSERVNISYFKNNTIPPMVVTVSGGHLTPDTIKRLEDYIEENHKGLNNFHKMMILEAESPDASAESKMKIELKPLINERQQDALFQEYDKRNDEKVGQCFRLPAMLRGDVGDVNSAVAEAAMSFAELQVFGPLRENFDQMINRLILPELGIVYYRYVSNAPSVRDPKGLATMIKELAKEGVLTPGEARDLCAGVFGHNLKKIRAYWTEQPLVLTTAGRGIGDNLETEGLDESGQFPGSTVATQDGKPDHSGQGAAAATANAAQRAGAPASTAGTIKALLQVKADLEAMEREAVGKAFAGEDLGVTTIKVPNALLRTFAIPEGE